MTARRVQGFTLLELLVVVTIVGLVAALAVPRLGTAFESARVAEAAAGLRSVWSAQRLHALEHGVPAASLERLAERRLLDAGLVASVEPFTFSLRARPDGRWTAQAVRTGSRRWSGTLSCDAAGELSGSLSDGSGRHVVPPGS